MVSRRASAPDDVVAAFTSCISTPRCFMCHTAANVAVEATHVPGGRRFVAMCRHGQDSTTVEVVELATSAVDEMVHGYRPRLVWPTLGGDVGHVNKVIHLIPSEFENGRRAVLEMRVIADQKLARCEEYVESQAARLRRYVAANVHTVAAYVIVQGMQLCGPIGTIDLVEAIRGPGGEAPVNRTLLATGERADVVAVTKETRTVVLRLRRVRDGSYFRAEVTDDHYLLASIKPEVAS